MIYPGKKSGDKSGVSLRKAMYPRVNKAIGSSLSTLFGAKNFYLEPQILGIRLETLAFFLLSFGFGLVL